MPPQQASGGGWSCGFIAVVVIGVCTLLCCGGLGGLGYFGMQLQDADAREALEDDPAVRTHVGRVREAKIVRRDYKDSDETEYVIELIGDKGGGKATFTYDDEEGWIEGKLELPDGRAVPLGEEAEEELK
jgi:hypothetical protein